MASADDSPNVKPTAAAGAAGEKSLVDRAGAIVAIVGGGGVISLLVIAYQIFSPIGEVDLTIRIDQQVQASLPSRAADNLQLVYNGQPIKRASVVTLEIINSGKKRIGADDQPWTLNLRSSDGSVVVALGDPRPTPTSRHVSVMKGPTSDVATVNFGLFNGGDKVAVDLMLIDPKPDGGIPIKAETNVPDLSEPVIGSRNVRERLRDAFVPPVLVLSAIGLATLLTHDRRKLQQVGVPLPSEYRMPKMIWIVVMGSLITTVVLANALAWFAALVLGRT